MNLSLIPEAEIQNVGAMLQGNWCTNRSDASLGRKVAQGELLAQQVVTAIDEQPGNYRRLYQNEESLPDKAAKIVKRFMADQMWSSQVWHSAN